MNKQESQLTADLMQAKVRLALITRMAQHNLENSPDQAEFTEVMKTILATCGCYTEH